MIEQVLRRNDGSYNRLMKPIFKPECILHAGVHTNFINLLQCGQAIYMAQHRLRNNHYWNGRLQNWGEDTKEVLNMTVYDDTALEIAEKLRIWEIKNNLSI